MKSAIICLILCAGFHLKSFAQFFVGVSYVSLQNKYSYSNLKVKQFLGTFGGLEVNQYVDFDFEKTSSFSTKSVLGDSGVSINFGYKFRFGRFYYTPEFFAMYDPTSVTDATVVPEQNFTGNVTVNLPFGGILIVPQVVDVPKQVQLINYKMPLNAGMISRIGYDFESVSVNIISGGTLTVFQVDDGSNSETIYKGRFIAGIGFEWNLSTKGNFKFFADYKYYIPIAKDIEREYPDPLNPGKITSVVIKNFKASSTTLDLGIKYYL